MSGAPTIGRLRRRVEILVPEDVPDGMGGATRTFVSGGFAWAAVETRRRRESVEDGRLTGLLVHRITLRAGPDVASGMVIRDGARRYRVLAVEPADPLRRYLVCHAEEEEP